MQNLTTANDDVGGLNVTHEARGVARPRAIPRRAPCDCSASLQPSSCTGGLIFEPYCDAQILFGVRVVCNQDVLPAD
jgi:hypothetical protein